MKLAFPLLLLITIGFAAFVTLVSNSSEARFDTTSWTTQEVTSARGPVRMVRFVLLHDGIYPRQMRVDQGFLNTQPVD